MPASLFAIVASLRFVKSAIGYIRVSHWQYSHLTLVLAFIGFMVWPANIFAQNIQNPQDSVDFKKRSAAHVDPSTLAMQLQIPLGNYQGRGGMSFPITLNYSSKLWRIGYLRTEGGVNGGDPKQIFGSFYGESSAAGWTSTLDWFLWPTINAANGETHFYGFEQPQDKYDINGKSASGTTYQRTVARMHVVLPDGSRHELRRDDMVLAAGSDTRSGTFYSVDSSGLRFESSTKTLYIPDGSRIIYDANSDGTPAAIHYVDRNGNQNTYNFATTQCNRWTDSLGRTFNIDLLVRCDGNPGIEIGDKTYSLPGMGGPGAPLNYTLRWRSLYGPNGETVLDVPLADEASRPYVGDHTNASSYSALSPSLFTTSLTNSIIVSEATRFNPVVLSQIILPNGAAYTFKYNTYGEIVRIEYPTGGYETFSYAQVDSLSGQIDDPLYAQANRGVIAQSMSAGQGAQVSSWTYATTINASQVPYRLARTIKAPDDSCTVILYHKSRQDSIKWGFDDAIAGKPYDERIYAQCPSPNGEGGVLLRRKLTKWVRSGPTPEDNNSTATRDPRVEKVADIIFDAGADALSTVTTYQYDTDLNTTAVTRHAYAWVNPAMAVSIGITSQGQFDDASFDQYLMGAAMVTEMTTYLTTDQNIDLTERAVYRGRNLIGLPTTKIVRSGSATGMIVSRMEVKYDELPLHTYNTVVGWSDPSLTKRGNATTIRRLVDTADPNTYIQTQTEYDQCGNVRVSRDALNRETRYGYEDSFTDTPRNTYAYLTSISTPVPDPEGKTGSQTPLITSSIYDYYTGAVVSTTNANSKTTQYEYAVTDVLGNSNPFQRLTKVTLPDGGSTAYGYGDQAGNLFIYTQTAIDNSRSLKTYKYFDGLYRPTRNAQYEGDVVGTWIATDTQYDKMSRVQYASNPFRVSSSSAPTPNYASYISTDFDALGRVTKITMPDRSQILTSYSGVPGSTMVGTPEMVTDQAGKKRGSIKDALGRLIEIIEDPGGLNYHTTYSYDVLDNLLTVTQGSQPNRRFTYDALSRLTSAFNPESGTVTYQYYESGSIKSETDARNVRTSYLYDSLNRIITRSYDYMGSGSLPDAYVATPTISYFYDGTGMPASISVPTNSKGALTAVKSSVAETIYTEFDLMGRVKKHSQIIDPGKSIEQSYQMEYSYDLAGNLRSQKYPSGRTITTDYDDAGRVSAVSGIKPEETTATIYSSQFAYEPHGAVREMRLGNGLFEHTVYDSNRLQPLLIGLGTSVTDQSLLRIDFSYYSGARGSQGQLIPDNNGNIRSQSISMPGLSLSQSYEYDGVNRLTSAQENNSAGAQTWKQSYTYADETSNNSQYGNRRVDSDPSNTTLNVLPAENPQIDPLSNRIKAGQGYAYDAAGNLKDTATGHHNAYDAENHIVNYDGGATITGGASYSYDGDGRRVKKVVGVVTTIFVYNILGQIVAEYSSETAAGSGTSYLTSDIFGAPRVITDQQRAVKSRHDYLPFGEEISATVGGRHAVTDGQLVSSYVVNDSIRQKFTGKERDTETGLDYFIARYYSSIQGRFTSADSFGGAAVNPQTLNLYAYGLNNPLKFIDPTGHSPISAALGRLPDNSKKIAALEEAWRQEDYADYGYTRAPSPPSFVASGETSEVESEQAHGGMGYGSVLGDATRATSIELCQTYESTYQNGVLVSRVLVSSEEKGVAKDVTHATIAYSPTITADKLGTAEPKFGKYTGDIRGHIIGRALGGPPTSTNLFSQNPTVNNSAYKRVENSIRKTLTAHQNWLALLRIELLYPPSSCKTPSNKEVFYRPYAVIYSVTYLTNSGQHLRGNPTVIPNPRVP